MCLVLSSKSEVSPRADYQRPLTALRHFLKGRLSSALADPLAAKGKTIFEGQSCNACHGDGGVGTAAAPALVGVSAKLNPDQLAALFKHPTAKMTAGGMPPIDLPPDDLKALIA